jgi:hypothetical protein
LRQAIRLLAGHFAIVEIVEAGFLNWENALNLHVS